MRPQPTAATEAPAAASSELARSRNADPVLELREFLRAVHVMKLYASAQGIAIPNETRDQLAALAPIEADVLAQSESQESPTLPRIDVRKALADAISAHAALSKLVAPATPDSIIYTQPPAGLADFRRRQGILFWMIVWAIGSIVLYLATLIYASVLAEAAPRIAQMKTRITALEKGVDRLEELEHDQATLAPDIDAQITELDRQNVVLANGAVSLPDAQRAPWPKDTITVALMDIKDRPTSASVGLGKIRDAIAQFKNAVADGDGEPQWVKVLLQHLKNLFAAMLGAAFYTLYTANTFVVRRTFDRAYTTQYIVRFVLGIVAGVILANFGEYVLRGNFGTGEDNSGIVLAQTVLALIGGYSADAVNAIFTRVAETLTTLVRGDSARNARREGEAENKVAQAEAEVEVNKAKQAEVARLQQLLAQATTNGANAELIAAIQSEIDALTGKSRPS